jgi:hypothetical protein
MKINLEILDCAFISAEKEIEDLQTKNLVPKMVTRRRLTRAAKIVIYLADQVNFTKGRIVYGNNFGELNATANIINAIKDKESISPTHFQNSVYNTAVSYLSILHANQEEILTISSGDNTAKNVLKLGAVKALQGDTLLLLVTETLNIDKIEEVNHCIDYLECGAALKVRLSSDSPNVDPTKIQKIKGLPLSVQEIFALAKNLNKQKKNIIEVTL